MLTLQNGSGYSKNYDEKLRLKFLFYENNYKDSLHLYYDTLGNIVLKETFKNDKRKSRIKFHSNGDTASQYHYAMDDDTKMISWYEDYYPNGVLKKSQEREHRSNSNIQFSHEGINTEFEMDMGYSEYIYIYKYFNKKGELTQILYSCDWGDDIRIYK